MRAHVYLSELLDAFEWVSAAGRFENAAYVHRQTGRIYWQSEAGDLEEEPPDDVDDATLQGFHVDECAVLDELPVVYGLPTEYTPAWPHPMLHRAGSE